MNQGQDGEASDHNIHVYDSVDAYEQQQQQHEVKVAVQPVPPATVATSAPDTSSANKELNPVAKFFKYFLGVPLLALVNTILFVPGFIVQLFYDRIRRSDPDLIDSVALGPLYDLSKFIQKRAKDLGLGEILPQTAHDIAEAESSLTQVQRDFVTKGKSLGYSTGIDRVTYETYAISNAILRLCAIRKKDPKLNLLSDDQIIAGVLKDLNNIQPVLKPLAPASAVFSMADEKETVVLPSPPILEELNKSWSDLKDKDIRDPDGELKGRKWFFSLFAFVFIPYSKLGRNKGIAHLFYNYFDFFVFFTVISFFAFGGTIPVGDTGYQFFWLVIMEGIVRLPQLFIQMIVQLRDLNNDYSKAQNSEVVDADGQRYAYPVDGEGIVINTRKRLWAERADIIGSWFANTCACGFVFILVWYNMVHILNEVAAHGLKLSEVTFGNTWAGGLPVFIFASIALFGYWLGKTITKACFYWGEKYSLEHGDKKRFDHDKIRMKNELVDSFIIMLSVGFTGFAMFVGQGVGFSESWNAAWGSMGNITIWNNTYIFGVSLSAIGFPICAASLCAGVINMVIGAWFRPKTWAEDMMIRGFFMAGLVALAAITAFVTLGLTVVSPYVFPAALLVCGLIIFGMGLLNGFKTYPGDHEYKDLAADKPIYVKGAEIREGLDQQSAPSSTFSIAQSVGPSAPSNEQSVTGQPNAQRGQLQGQNQDQQQQQNLSSPAALLAANSAFSGESTGSKPVSSTSTTDSHQP